MCGHAADGAGDCKKARGIPGLRVRNDQYQWLATQKL